MKNLRFILTFIALQAVAIAATWYFSTPEQRKGYLVFLGLQEAEEGGSERDPLVIGARRIEQRARREVDQSFSCTPETRPITAVKKNGVYHWTDADGKPHFSDRPPTGSNVENLTKQYSSRQQYFTIEVENSGNTLPAYMQDRLSADTRQIFKVLADQLDVSELRQVDLQVKVFDNRQVFNGFKKKIAPGLGNNVAGFYSSGHNLAAVMRNRNDERTFSTARHESAHVIIAGLFGNIPTWFTEGLAEYFEQMTLSGQLKTIHPNHGWIKLLNQKMRQGQLMSLQQYFSYDRQSWRNQDQNTMYAMAWAVTYFLMDSRQGKQHLSRFMQELTRDRCQSPNTAEYFARNYRGGLNRLNQDWRRWLAQGQPSAHRY